MKTINEQERSIDRAKKVFQPPIRYENKLLLYRKRWLDVYEKYPNGSRSDFKKADSGAAVWLRKYDNEWYLNNSPQIKLHKVTPVLNDWVKIDNELKSMVEDAVIYIKNLVGKPERITKGNIGRYMQQKNMILENYKLLPCTMYKIKQYVESADDFRLRRIEWAKRELEKEGKPVTPYIILRKAGINREYNKFRQLLT